MIDTSLLAIAATISAVLLGTIFTVFYVRVRRAKKSTKKVETTVIGRRPSSNRAAIRKVVFTRGKYTWEEGDDFKVDIYADPQFLTPTPEGPIIEVDLDSGHPIMYLGEAINDIGAVAIKRWSALPPKTDKDGHHQANGHDLRADGAVTGIKTVVVMRDDAAIEYAGPDVTVTRRDKSKVTLRDVWVRLPGSRLYNIRKSIKIQQLSQTLPEWWVAFMKFVPWMIVLTLALVLVIAGLTLFKK